MSDNLRIRNLLGNSRSGYPGRRRLVEECEVVRIEVVQQAFGKKKLMETVRQARPFRLPVPGGYFDVLVLDVPHRLPGSLERWSCREDGTIRLYFWCLGCRRKVSKLYYYFLGHGSSVRSELLCRRCHGLTYQSVNCGKSQWYKKKARPLKRLLKEKERLQAKKPTARIRERLAQTERVLTYLRGEPKPKTHPQHPRVPYGWPVIGQRRPYRDLSLIESAGSRRL